MFAVMLSRVSYLKDTISASMDGNIVKSLIRQSIHITEDSRL